MSNYYDLIKKGLSGAVNVAAGAVSKAAEVAKDLAEDLTSVKALKDYKLAGHVATAGPGSIWKIYNAISKKPGALFPEAAVWVLDKKQLIDQASRGGRARGFDQFFEQQRRGCAQLLRIKHPGVLKVLEQLEETSNQMVMVTEPVFGSLQNLQTHFRDVANSTPERASAQLSQLEIKYGMMHVAETVQFLHQEAKLVHCNLNPGSLIVTKDGSWKLSGFAFVGSCDFGGAQGQLTSFEYVSSQPAPWEEYVVPPLAYTAPEMLAGSMAVSEQRLHPACDVFSLAAITYELVKGKPLLPVGSSLGEYRSRLSMLSGVDMSGVPGTLQAALAPMMATAAAARPNAAAFASCQWFQEDMLLRALRFLDGILQRESSQKVAFLKDLSTFWQQFDERLLLHKILPPIVQEMRNEMVSLAALPMVLAIMGKMTPEQFRDSGILPVIKPVFDTADGELLLALVRHLGVFHKLMTGDAVATTLLPLLLRACDSASTKTQEEVLRGLRASALDLPYQVLRDALMPKVIAMCLRTTSLVVRCAALGLMTQAVPRLDKEAALAMLDVSGKVLAVDKSAGTAMAVLALGEATAKHYGTEVAAQLVLPMLCPLLVAPTLSNQQFAACMLAMRGMLDAVQEKRGVTDLAAAAAATSGVGAGGGGTAPSTPMSTASSGAAATSSGLGSSSNNSMSSWSAAVGSGAADGVGGAAGASGGSSWQSAASFGAGASPSSTRPAAQAAPSSSWSNAAMGSSWAAPSTSNTSTSMAQGGGLGASGSAGGSGGWGASWPAAGGVAATSTSAPAGVKPGAPAPDIFSDPSAGLGSLGGLSLSGTPSLQQQQQVGGLGGGAADSDLFGGLSMRTVSPAGAPASTSSRPSWSSGPPQQQQQQQTAGIGGFGLQPPPSAKTSIGVTNLVSTSTSSSSSAQDPFAMLGSGPPAATTTSTWQTAAAAPAAPLAGSSAAFDPFASPAAAGDPFAALSAAPPSRPMGGAPAAAAGGVDPFASLAAGSKPMGMAQQKAQQQQQWGGPGGSLI